MGYSVRQMRELLRLSAQLRDFAAGSTCPDYAGRLLTAAAELEMQARFMAEHRELEQSAVQNDAALHAPVNLVI